MRKSSSDETDITSKFASILRLRGGEEEKKGTTDKIKGCCIGIDLGTTYRYVPAIFNSPTPYPPILIIFLFLQLCRRVEEWESRDLP